MSKSTPNSSPGPNGGKTTRRRRRVPGGGTGPSVPDSQLRVTAHSLWFAAGLRAPGDCRNFCLETIWPNYPCGWHQACN